MPEAFNRIWQRTLEIWKTMDKSQKTRLILFTVIILTSVFLAVYLTTRPNYTKLTSGTTKEIGAISKALEEKGIIHKINKDSTSISVKQKDLDGAQILLAQSGFTNAEMKFEDAMSLFKFSTTESDKKKIFKEYYENKIANSLKKMDTISDASVTLSIPEKSIFVSSDDTDKPTASVRIEPKDKLTGKQINGIARFVASSVENLDPKDVTIVDNSGAILNEEDSDMGTSTNKQFEYQAKKKREIEGQVKELLSNMTDNVRVVANIVLDFNAQTTKSVKYSSPIEGSDQGMIRSEQNSKEQLQNGNSQDIPGTDSNSGTPSYPQSNGGNSSYSKNDSTKNYELNQENTEFVKSLGNIDSEKSSLTVNLLYGLTYQNAPSQDEITRITKMVSSATGIMESRITVASFKLNNQSSTKSVFDWQGSIEKFGPFALLTIVLLIMGIALISKRKSSETELALAGSLGMPIDMIPEATKSRENRDSAEEIEYGEKSEVKKQIDSFVKQKPDAVAQLLRNWLAEEWDD